MPLTPEDVRNKQFTTVRLREGYDEDEVDAFLDEVEAELTRLLRENEDLRAKLAAATRAAAQNQQQQGMRKPPEPQDGRGPGAPVPAAISGPPVSSRRPRRWARPSCPAVLRSCPPAPAARAARRVPARWAAPWAARCRVRWAGPMGQGDAAPWARAACPADAADGSADAGQMQQMRPMGGPMGGPQMPAARAPVATAPRVSSRWPSRPPTRRSPRPVPRPTRSSARRAARAEGLERDARAKADALERDAQEKHRVAMGSLESARATLERKVEDLRGFEREYRTRLKSYLESQLRQLETQADDSLAPPRTPATASLPPSPAPSMAPAGAGAMGQSYGGNRHGRWAVAPARWAAPRRTAASSRCPRR